MGIYTPINIRTWSLLGQRGSFGKMMLELAQNNPKIWAMTADQGRLSGLSSFKAQYPNRYINFGISEQNAIEVASGLANEGFVPFLSFQSAFTTTRCADQVRICMSYMKLNVKLIGIFAGLTVSDCGPTHYSLEDFAFFRTLPNLVVLAPSDTTSAIKVLEKVAQINAPVYIRLDGRINMPIVYKEDFEFEIGRAIWLREGEDVCIIATGSMVYQSLKAADKLEAEGLKTGVVDMHTIKPLDVQAIEKACEAKLIVTIEEHSKFGGLGSAVAEALAIKSKRPAQVMIGTEDYYAHAGDYEYLLEEYGLTAPQIVAKIVETYKNLRGGVEKANLIRLKQEKNPLFAQSGFFCVLNNPKFHKISSVRREVLHA